MMKHKNKHQVLIINLIVLCVFVVLVALAVKNYRDHPRDRAYFNGTAYELSVATNRVHVEYDTAVDRGRLSAHRDLTPEDTSESANAEGPLSRALAMVSGFFFNKKIGQNQTVATQPPAEAGDVAALLSNEIIIDTSEDHQTLGYSGQRKIDHNLAGDLYIAYRKKFEGEQQIFLAQLQKLDRDYMLRRLLQPISITLLGITQRVPSISVNTRDVAYLVWYGSADAQNEDNRQIRYSKMVGTGNTWTPSNVVSAVDGHDPGKTEYWQEHPQAIAGMLNSIFVVWEGKDENNPRQQIKFSKSPDGGDTWTNWKNINTYTVTQSRPTILQDQNGRLHLLMYSSGNTRSGTEQIQYAYSDDYGETWSNWRIVSDDKFDARHVSATVRDNRVYLVYREKTSADGPTKIMFVKGETNNWSRPVVISSFDSNAYHYFPSIGITPTGQMCATWLQTKTDSDYPNEAPDSGDVYLSCSKDDIFGNPIKLTDNGNSIYPNLPMSIDSNLNIPVLYYNTEDSTIRMRFVAVY